VIWSTPVVRLSGWRGPLGAGPPVDRRALRPLLTGVSVADRCHASMQEEPALHAVRGNVDLILDTTYCSVQYTFPPQVGSRGPHVVLWLAAGQHPLFHHWNGDPMRDCQIGTPHLKPKPCPVLNAEQNQQYVIAFSTALARWAALISPSLGRPTKAFGHQKVFRAWRSTPNGMASLRSCGHAMQEQVVAFALDAVRAEAFNPRALFLFGSYTIGKERLFLEIAHALGKKARSCPLLSAPTEATRMCLVLLGTQNRTLGPYSAYRHSILVSVMAARCISAAQTHGVARILAGLHASLPARPDVCEVARLGEARGLGLSNSPRNPR
jgi:hypothetical protein